MRAPSTVHGELNAEHAMWITLFAFATGVAVCLSVAAIISGGLLRDWLRRIRDETARPSGAPGAPEITH
jgi:hypothetical protein